MRAPSPSQRNGSGARVRVPAACGKVGRWFSGGSGSEVDGVRARPHRPKPGGPDGDPGDVPATEPQASLDDRVPTQVTDPAARGVVDVEHPVAVTGQHEHDVPWAHRVADVE